MHWNNRILRHPDGSYGLHEVFYNDEGKPSACTEESLIGQYESVTELRKILDLMLKDVRSNNPVLKWDDFGKGGKYAKNDL